MDLLGKWTVLFVGIIFHTAFLLSIFDIYFVSPLVHGMKHHKSQLTFEPPAKRLFLMVGDGLRADKCFDNITNPITGTSEYLAPFIRDRALTAGTFGISHTRVPTESRPGHVAMIAGFYEDVSAVTKGWKENPVDFDSVFNQSRHTWSYGSPDILPMFAQGAEEGKVDASMYGHDFEDFTKSTIELDKFVFDSIDDLFAQAQSNSTLSSLLNQDKIVFFLHLLGIDTAGHGYRPYSAEYYDNIKYIDTKIKELEAKVNKFYNDKKTAWVFTADHGMSDFGSHGDGHPDNTRTPLVVWGAGVSPPVAAKVDPGDHDEYSAPWEMNTVRRNDVNQADIASLMSYLVGINYAANSVGELPLNYLDAPDKAKAEGLFSNAMSIIEQYWVKETITKQSQFHYVPLKEPQYIDSLISEIQQLIESGSEEDLKLAFQHSQELIEIGLKGLRYLQTYNWQFLMTLVTMGYLGWIGYAMSSFIHLFVVKDPIKFTPTQVITVRFLYLSTFVALSALLYQQQSPPNYYLYALFPNYFWCVVTENYKTVAKGISLLIHRTHSKYPLWSAFGTVVLGTVLLESIVFGYFDRQIFSWLFSVGAMWPFIHNGKKACQNWKLAIFWALLCLSLAVFTILPANKTENIQLIVAAGVLMTVVSMFSISWQASLLHLDLYSLVLCGIQLGLIILSVVVTRSSVESLQARRGLPLGNQIVGWGLLILSLIVPFFQKRISDYRYRLLVIFMAFCPSFVILTISYEGLFYVTFFALLLVWLEFEYIFHGRLEEFSLGEFRISLFFFLFSQVGFFGTGNIASISSFSLDSVTRLIPVFDPFAMGALLIFKILIPFIVLSVCLGILNLRLAVPQSALFSMVLSVSDILTLNFFYLVVDEGSWLDIGTGISHFSISSMLCLFMILLEYLSGLLVRGVTLPVNSEPGSTKVESAGH